MQLKFLGLCTFFIILFSCGSASAQSGTDEVDDASASHLFFELSAAGATNCNCWGMLTKGGFEHNGRHAVTTIAGSFDTLNSGHLKTGTTYRVSGESYARLTRQLLAGGGASWGRLVASNWSKSATHPFLGGGVEFLNNRVLANWYFAGSDHTNGTRGASVEGDIALGEHVFYILGVGSYTAYPDNCPSCQRVAVRRCTLGFKLRF